MSEDQPEAINRWLRLGIIIVCSLIFGWLTHATDAERFIMMLVMLGTLPR